VAARRASATAAGRCCSLLTDPAQVTCALARARGGAWLPQELQARQATIRKALGQLDRQRQRLLEAYRPP
jgi:site-specific DNA recombinase